MEWSGPAIRPGLDNRHLIIEGDKRSLKVREGHGRSWKVKEGHGRSWVVLSYPITRLAFQVRKVMGGQALEYSEN